MESFFDLMEMKLFRVNDAGHGFILGRTLSLIFNECHYALDDFIATEKNIDLAMKHGVHYPLGPMEWFRMIGPIPVIRLLESLYLKTGDKRYIPSKGLTESFQSHFQG